MQQIVMEHYHVALELRSLFHGKELLKMFIYFFEKLLLGNADNFQNVHRKKIEVIFEFGTKKDTSKKVTTEGELNRYIEVSCHFFSGLTQYFHYMKFALLSY